VLQKRWLSVPFLVAALGIAWCGLSSAQTADPAVRADYDAAFERTLQNPSDPQTVVKFAELAVQVGDIEGAISALERLLVLDADQPDVELELGVLYYRIGSVEAARTYLNAVRSSSQASSDAKKRAEEFLKAAN